MKKIYILSAVCVIALCFGIFLTNIINGNKEEKRLEEITESYTELNRIFSERIDHYVPFEPSSYSPDGIHSGTYLSIEYYRQQTGIEFYYEDVVEYFSQEYEEDGSLRLYNNGLHPEIEAYIEWCNNFYDERFDYLDNINRIWGEYFQEHRDEGFENSALYTWSRATLDELIRKEADPTYEMDLMSIQQQERAEAEGQEAT